jgi:hypothetical protein
MFQPKMLFEAYAYHSRVGEGDSRPTGIMYLNSTLFPEGEGVTATCLGSLFVSDEYKEINRKSAPNELFLVSNYKNERR